MDGIDGPQADGAERYAADHVEGDAAYRPVSPLAVLGLVLALASPLALVTAWLLPLPIVAAVVCWAATADVRRSEGTKTGRGIALAGLAIALMVLGAMQGRDAVAQRLHADAAAPVAKAFLENLRAGELAAAHELTLGRRLRQPTTAAAEVFYAEDPDAKKRLADFESNPAISRLLAGGDPPRLVEQARATPLRHGLLSMLWSYELPAHGDAPSALLRLELRRSVNRGSGVASWKVADFDLAPPAG